MARSRLRQNRVVARACRSLAWAIVWFVVMQVTTVAVLEWRQPAFYDPKYGCRLKSLRDRLSQDHGAPLVVILGTSRAEQGLRPSLLHTLPVDKPPVVFNFARGGSSPLLNLLTLE